MNNILKTLIQSKNCSDRATNPFNYILTSLQSQYKQLVKKSQISQVLYLALPEADRKPQNKVFFCSKYPDFHKFLAVNHLRPVGKDDSKAVKAFSKPNKTQVGGDSKG